MKTITRYCAILSAMTVAGCGGDVTMIGGESINNNADTTYAFTIPAINTHQVYAETIVDNANNTINLTLRHTVTAVDPNRISYTYQQDDPSNSSATVNGTNYAVTVESVTANASGQKIAYSYTPAGGSFTQCSVTPHGAGPDSPLSIGQTWTSSYVVSCGFSATSYTQTGSVVGVETITVPAGTYTAVKIQSTLVWTDGVGTTRVQTITRWRDVDSSRTVKRIVTTAYSGVLPTTGYPVSDTLVLQNMS